VLLGQVVGVIWTTRKHQDLKQVKLVIVRPYAQYQLSPVSDHLVAVDQLDAGVGENVIICFGSPARLSLGQKNIPVDAAVMAIVDHCQLSRKNFSFPSAPVPNDRRFPDGMEWIDE